MGGGGGFYLSDISGKTCPVVLSVQPAAAQLIVPTFHHHLMALMACYADDAFSLMWAWDHRRRGSDRDVWHYNPMSLNRPGFSLLLFTPSLQQVEVGRIEEKLSPVGGHVGRGSGES